MSQSHEQLVARLESSTNPVIQYKLRRYVRGADPDNPDMRRLRSSIKDSPIAQALRQDLVESDPADRHGMATIYLTLRYLADIDYPRGDASLMPFLDHLHGWLRKLEGEYDGPLFIRGKSGVPSSHGTLRGGSCHSGSPALGHLVYALGRFCALTGASWRSCGLRRRWGARPASCQGG
jgi:hypothetical protein